MSHTGATGISETSLREILARTREQYNAAFEQAVKEDRYYAGENVDLDDLREVVLHNALAVVDATAPGEFWILEFQHYEIRGSRRYKINGPMAAVFASREEAIRRLEIFGNNAAGGTPPLDDMQDAEYDYRLYRTDGYGRAAEAEEYGKVTKDGVV